MLISAILSVRPRALRPRVRTHAGAHRELSCRSSPRSYRGETPRRLSPYRVRERARSPQRQPGERCTARRNCASAPHGAFCAEVSAQYLIDIVIPARRFDYSQQLFNISVFFFCKIFFSPWYFPLSASADIIRTLQSCDTARYISDFSRLVFRSGSSDEKRYISRESAGIFIPRKPSSKNILKIRLMRM